MIAMQHITADALAICERAEEQMTALEDQITGYRVAVAMLVLAIRDRQRRDRLSDGRLLPTDAARHERENRIIGQVHRHDDDTVRILEGDRSAPREMVQ